MPVKYKVKFDDDGKVCRKDLDYLRKHPECGFPTMENKPFNPVNPTPIHKFKQINRDFDMKNLDKLVPRVPSEPVPRISPDTIISGDPTARMLGDPLGQDYTNILVAGRRLLMDNYNSNSDGYEPVRNYETPFRSTGYAHQDLIPSFEPSDPIGVRGERYEIGGDVPLEDFGAGTGINLGTDFEALPRGDPRTAEEFSTMESINELMERSEQSLIRSSRILGRPGDVELQEIPRPRGINQQDLELQEFQNLTRNETPAQAERIRRVMFRDLPASVPERGRLRQSRLLPPDSPPSPPEEEQRPQRRSRRPQPQEEGTELFVIDPEAEERLIIEEAEKFIRRGRTSISKNEAEAISKKYTKKGMTQKRIYEILEEFNLYDRVFEEQLSQITDSNERALMRRMRAMRIIHEDTNLTPERFVDIDIEPQTPMLSREPGMGRSRIQKEIQRRAGQLPEELRGIYKQAERSAGQFSENIRSRSLDAIQQIRATSQRAFGRSYSQVFPTEFDSARNVHGVQELATDSGIISARPNITEEVTGIRANDITATPEPFSVGFKGTPKITYAKTIRLAKEIGRGAISREAGITGAGALSGIGIGYGVGYGMNLAFEKLGIHENMATASLTGGIAGSTADVGSRIIGMGISKSLQRAGVEVGAQTLASAGTRALIRGAGEGLVVGAILTPIDIIFNNALVSKGLSHTEANITSSAVVGTTATGATAIGLASLGASPETMGASLVVGALAIGVTSAIGFVTGQTQDRQEEEARKIRESLNATSQERRKLINTLKDYNYNYEEAESHYGEKPGQNRLALGYGDDTWNAFNTSNKFMFQQKPRPYNPPSDHTKELSDEDRKVNELFSKFVLNETIRQICNEGSCSDELKAQDPGSLTIKETGFLNDKTGHTWLNQAELQVATQMNNLKFTQKRIIDAKTEMLDSWNNKQELVSQDILNVAYLDPTWKQKFDTFVKLDAQNRVVNAYQDSQTRIEQMPKTIRDLANQDPEFNTYIHHYYNDMETTAGQLNISVPQLITLQGTPLDRQGEVYEGMQFDNMKQNPDIVADAQEIVSEEDAVRKAEFYDIDQAYLESDPTNLTTWIPSDAQILQAYNAGMTLREYTDYMHELAKGEDGDFSRLPVYTQEQIKQFTDSDVAHFQDELNMSGHQGLYTWDAVNRNWILNHGNQNNAISNQHYISKYTPGRLLKARQEYADMIHGLNEQNQNAVDNFNNNLMRDLSVYGRHYDAMVADVNNERLREGRTDLLYFDIGKIYDKNKIEFKPFSDVMTSQPVKTSVSSVVDTNNRQLGEQVSIKQRYGLSDKEYSDVKRDIISKNIKDPTMEQVETAIQEVKSSPTDSPPMAS